MRTIIIDKELQPYIVASQGTTHNGTKVVVLNTVIEEDLRKYREGSVKWFTDGLGITRLDYYYFNCKGLTDITLPQKLPVLSDAMSMFASCTGLTEVTLPKELPMLINTNNMFYGCTGLKEVTLPEKLPKLEGVLGMFCDCTSLRKVTMSEEVYNKFHKYMFAGLDEDKIEFVFY